MRSEIWFVSLLAFVASAPAQGRGGRPADRGGAIGDYMRRVVSASGQRHVISGDCMSACTIWLGHSGTCVMPDAVLWFHSATVGRSDTGRLSASGNETLLAMYPPRVRAVVRPWLRYHGYHRLTASQLVALGVPMCR